MSRKLINKILTEANVLTENIWYHGSNQKIKKFLFSLVGQKSDRPIQNYYGYGIYFIKNIDRAKKYGEVISKVNINQNADLLEGNIKSKQLLKIYNQLKKEGVKLNKDLSNIYKNPTYGKYSILTDVEEFYDSFQRFYKDKFKDIKDVSEFLLRSGIDGLIVINDVNDKILVVFNEDIINIIED